MLLAELRRIADAAPSLVTDLNDADVTALEADAARRHYLHGEVLIDVQTREVLESAA